MILNNTDYSAKGNGNIAYGKNSDGMTRKSCSNNASGYGGTHVDEDPDMDQFEKAKLYPILSREVIFAYMMHNYQYQKDITYKKARKYVAEGMIYDLQCNADCTVFTAKSEGSDDEIYSCKLVFVNKKLQKFKCTCMSYKNWHTPCKHLIGMMILIERKRKELLRKKREAKAAKKTGIGTSGLQFQSINSSVKYESPETNGSVSGEMNHMIGTTKSCGQNIRDNFAKEEISSQSEGNTTPPVAERASTQQTTASGSEFEDAIKAREQLFKNRKKARRIVGVSAIAMSVLTTLCCLPVVFLADTKYAWNDGVTAWTILFTIVSGGLSAYAFNVAYEEDKSVSLFAKLIMIGLFVGIVQFFFLMFGLLFLQVKIVSGESIAFPILIHVIVFVWDIVVTCFIGFMRIRKSQ